MDSQELLRVWIEEVWHEGRMDRAAECLGDTYTRHDPQGNRIVTRDEYIAAIQELRARMPDIHFHLDDSTVSDDRIWGRFRMTGTNSENAEAVNISALQVYRVEGGRLVETWAAWAPDGHDWSAPIG